MASFPGEVPHHEDAVLVWAQTGITEPDDARRFLEALRSPDLLLMPSADGDVGYPLSRVSHLRRGHGASVSANVIAASRPPAELLAHHRALGLGPERIYCPSAPSARRRLAGLVLDDDALVSRIRTDGGLRRVLFAYKDRDAARLAERLRLEPVYGAPDPAAYDAANDKLRFWSAGDAHGFAVLPFEVADDEAGLDAAYRRLDAIHGEGCLLRFRRGAGGNAIGHARSPAIARRVWRTLRRRGEVLITPYVPRDRIVRNVSLHGIVTAAGFAPLLFGDQIVSGFRFRGNRVGDDWSAEEIAAVRRAIHGIAGWMRGVGFVDGLAGIDGLLLRGRSGPEFVALDPNARWTASIGPWAVVADLGERAGRRFVWQFESFRVLGSALTLARLRRRLGGDLLDAARIGSGGVLPSSMATLAVGGFGAFWMTAVLLAHDDDHLRHLRRRTRAALGGFG